MSIYTSRCASNRSVLHEVLPLDTPFSLGVFMGDCCNFSCKYCERSVSPKGNINSIPMDTFKEIILQAKKFPHRIKTFTNFGSGEHLIDKKLAEKYALVSNENIADIRQLTTNASLFTHERIRELIDAGINKIVCSLQGVSSQTYKNLCGVDIDIKKLNDNLEYLYLYSRGKCRIHIKTLDVALDTQADEKEIFLEMYKNICDTIYIDSMVPLYSEVDYSENISPFQANNFKDINTKTIIEGLVPPHEVKSCRAIFHDLFVWANGEISPCCNAKTDFTIGHIYQEGLLGSWHGEKRLDLLRRSLMFKIKELPSCTDCRLPNCNTHTEDQLEPYVDNLLKRFGFNQ